MTKVNVLEARPIIFGARTVSASEARAIARAYERRNIAQILIDMGLDNSVDEALAMADNILEEMECGGYSFEGALARV